MSSLKNYLIESYSDDLQKKTIKLQEYVIKSATAKNQWIFLERCLSHKIIPRSFRIKSPIKNKRSQRITDRFREKLLWIAKSEAKGRYYASCSKVRDIISYIKNILSKEDFEKILAIIEKTRENRFISVRSKMQEKFRKLKLEKYAINRTKYKPRNEPNLIKDAVLNLTSRDLPDHHKSLLNLGPKFVPTTDKIPYMNIITSTELAAESLEKLKKHEEAEHLRSEVCTALKSTLQNKVKSNITKEQSQALKELTYKGNHTKVYPFDKGSGFAILDDAEATKKLEEQIGECEIVDKDPTPSIAEKFKKTLCNLRKEGKFDKKTYFQMYPSDPIAPRMYGMIKAHKKTKNYPMRLVVSTVGTPSYGTSKLLVDLIQPTLNKNPIRVKNSSSFVNESRTWEIDKDEVQVSYDVVALYPSVPVSKAIDGITDILAADMHEIKKRTKLTLLDIRSLIELCLQKCYFVWKNKIYVIKDAGPIGLSLMVVVAEAYLQILEKNALREALHLRILPKTFRRYVDDSHARFNSFEEAERFLTILNSQDPRIQYTIEREDDEKQLPFLDILVHNAGSGLYDFKVYRKEAITNVQIKPNSCIDGKVIVGVFKGFLARAWRICSEKHRNEEFEFLIKVFSENGHDENLLRSIKDSYKPPELRPTIAVNNATDEKPIVKLPWIPKVTPKLKKIYKKKRFKSRLIFDAQFKNHFMQE